MKIYHCEQRSPEWYRRRLGRPTASNAHRILTPDGKESRQRRKYLYALVFERLVGMSLERDLSNIKAVRDGIIREPIARQKFLSLSGVQIDQVGLITTDDDELVCSPDGIIAGRNESVEIKCPEGATQIGYLLDGLETEYRPQIQMQLLVGGWDATHFFAYHPNTPPFYQRVLPDEAYQKKLWAALYQFVKEVEEATACAQLTGTFITAEEMMNWIDIEDDPIE